MPGSRAYLDYNSSAPLLPAARTAMLAALDAGANASSVHDEGRTARRMIEDARREVAALVGGSPEHVVFTSGATEAASTLLSPDWLYGRAAVRMSRLYVSAADHPCLLNGGRFPRDRVKAIGVRGDGTADIAALGEALQGHDREAGLPLVAIHLANNETGVIQPVREIADAVKAAGGVLVLDAVQAAGRIPLDVAAADFLILSSHKIGGPAGSGAFVAASGLMMPKPLVSGGGQEKGLRAGTENLPGIAGFGAAARAAAEALPAMTRLAGLRDRIEDAVLRLAPGARIFGRGADRLPNTVFFAIPGLKAETAQIGFDLAGVAVSAGSACSSGKIGPSHVLEAMGYGDNEGALRVSIGHATSLAEIDAFEAALAGIVARSAQARTKAA
ncbi:MAG: cysteine desulfarase [Rhizobiaceae bacterium]|nr:cysteine desulfarase [Rhizobiaceae bacterium]